MSNKTYKGYQLADKLHLTESEHIVTCSLIARHAVSYERIQEGHCNGHPAMGNPNIPIESANKLQEKFEAWLDKRDTQLEKRITELAATLPGIKKVIFNGDPRGCVVKLLRDTDRDGEQYDDGVCVF